MTDELADEMVKLYQPCLDQALLGFETWLALYLGPGQEPLSEREKTLCEWAIKRGIITALTEARTAALESREQKVSVSELCSTPSPFEEYMCCIRLGGHDGIHIDGSGKAWEDDPQGTIWSLRCSSPAPGYVPHHCTRPSGHSGRHIDESGYTWEDEETNLCSGLTRGYLGIHRCVKVAGHFSPRHIDKDGYNWIDKEQQDTDRLQCSSKGPGYVDAHDCIKVAGHSADHIDRYGNYWD